MVASVKKQAAKIANKAIQQADEQAKATVQEKPEFLKRLEDSNLARETEGRDAFTNLRRLRGEKLPHGDEVIIARHLYDELPVLKRHLRAQKSGIGEFCNRYGIADVSESSKELHRLTLSPSKDPKKVRLRRAAGKYSLLIEGISKTTKESVSSLADRVLMGTSLHPAKQLGSLSEAEKLQTVLQRIVDKIDDEFGLYAKFMETAELKAKHIANGGKEHWPLWDISREYSWSSEEYEQDIADATDVRYAFWRRDRRQQRAAEFAAAHDAEFIRLFGNVEETSSSEALGGPADYLGWPMADESGALQDSEFFYVPHVPLGVIIYVDLPRRDSSPVKYEQSVQNNLDRWRRIDERTGKSWVALECSVSDEWDSENRHPHGQIDIQPTYSRGTDFAWLVIYPTQDGSRLMPMLYISHEEGGPYLLPLDARNLEIFRDAIWLNETDHMSVFDRVKELLGYRPNTPKIIEDGFRRTAPWFDHNPFFKMKQKHVDDLQMLDAFCQQIWEEK